MANFSKTHLNSPFFPEFPFISRSASGNLNPMLSADHSVIEDMDNFLVDGVFSGSKNKSCWNCQRYNQIKFINKRFEIWVTSQTRVASGKIRIIL